MAQLDHLPDELIHQILQYVAPEDIIRNIWPLSTRFNSVSQEPLLWRYHCRTSFKYWQSDHDFQSKLALNVHQVDWRRLFLLRLARNHRIAHLVDGIVASRVCRLQRTEQICQYGYDAKDFLLTQCRVDDSAPDVLARRYYACTVLDSIHRSLAIEEWAKYQKHAARHVEDDTPNRDRLNCGMRLERALGAFDMFMLHDNEGDLDEICELLDNMAARFENAHTNIQSMTTREKAIALARWLHSNNMTGLADPDETYRYLRNCLIGRALRDDTHPSLPIISAAIYSVIATRLGIEAYPAALPSHVHAIVLSTPGMSLDDKPLPENSPYEQENMFLDPYGSDDEVPLEDILGFLRRLGISTGLDNLLGPTATDLVIMRTAQNIRASFTSFRTSERPLSQLIPMIELNRGDWARNLQPALYSMIWASIMMIPILPNNEDARWDWQQDVRDLLQYFYEYFPEDSWLVEKYLCPMYDTFAAPSRRHDTFELPSKGVRDQIRDIRMHDSSAKPPRLRSDLPDEVNVKYRVGQVFKHKRYDYHGLILGWNFHGASGSVDSQGRLSQGPPFYRCMVGTDGSDHHIIAEDSIEVVELHGGVDVLPPEIKDLIPMAGKFFKRWDGEAGVFVSNLRESYPED
ncbi:hypothetical protein F4778DRAFT_752489 [Xylariomycetidae sp. FL2044]|nr:hypothetical protein F4778DRAFT_752489 [Xylariomycetidae sp. FL2044]